MAQLTLLLWACLSAHGKSIPDRPQSERFWLAGRYDGNRIIVYFDAVHFNGTMPAHARALAPPVAEGFFASVELPATYLAQFEPREHFLAGGHYDLLLGTGAVATVALTTLLGSEGDEAVGNYSFIGALATVQQPSELTGTTGYYALRRHQESDRAGGPSGPGTPTTYAGLVAEPVSFDIETQIAALLSQRMQAMAPDADRARLRGTPPALAVQPFRLADGSLRYYARAQWKLGPDGPLPSACVLAAWFVASAGKLRMLALETRTSPYGFEHALPNLLNVVDLGHGRTGLIVAIFGEDSRSLLLVEYCDDVRLAQMTVLQTVGAGE